jgi:hypothetical protein
VPEEADDLGLALRKEWARFFTDHRPSTARRSKQRSPLPHGRPATRTPPAALAPLAAALEALASVLALAVLWEL